VTISADLAGQGARWRRADQSDCRPGVAAPWNPGRKVAVPQVFIGPRLTTGRWATTSSQKTLAAHRLPS